MATVMAAWDDDVAVLAPNFPGGGAVGMRMVSDGVSRCCCLLGSPVVLASSCQVQWFRARPDLYRSTVVERDRYATTYSVHLVVRGRFGWWRR
jgi:hypothetical protein